MSHAMLVATDDSFRLYPCRFCSASQHCLRSFLEADRSRNPEYGMRRRF